MAEAANCRPPSRVERAGYTCRPDTVAAVRHCVKTGEKLPVWRMSQARVLSRVRKAIEPLNAVLRKAQPPPPSIFNVDAANVITLVHNFIASKATRHITRRECVVREREADPRAGRPTARA